MKMTDEQIRLALNSNEKPIKTKPIPPPDDPFALAPGERYASTMDADVEHFLDNSNQPEETKLYGASAWPPLTGTGLWARVLRSHRLFGGSKNPAEIERYVQMLEHTKSGQIKSEAIDALQCTLRFHGPLAPEIDRRVNQALEQVFGDVTKHFSESFGGQKHEQR